MKTSIAIAACAASLAIPTAHAQDKPPSTQETVRAKLPVYKRVAGISGNLSSVGSDTLNNLMTLWAEDFRRLYPNVKIQIEGKGSSTAPPALISGLAQLGPMSRRMKPSEIDKFEKKFGYEPTLIKVAIDALALYVHKDNPLEKLTLQEVDAIFSKNRKGGHKADIKTWGDVGMTGEWQKSPIRLYGRNSASGTYGYFKKVALFKGDYKAKVAEQPGSASVVRSVTEDIFGIGYSGIGYKTSGVKTLKLAKKPGAPYFGTDSKTVLSGKYPLARYLYVYVNKAPGKSLDPLVREFLRLTLSKQGQTIVVKDGYLPLPAKVASRQLPGSSE